VRCGRCGNENSEGNRFCGMCGASLLPKTETANRTAVSGVDKRPEAAITTPSGEVRLPTRPASDVNVPAANRPPAPGSTIAAQIPTPLAEPAPVSSIPDPPRNGSPVNGDPVISGPSFLGLNKPADGRSARAYSSRSHDLHTSGNLDYLLDDDEEEPKRGGGKLFLVVIALALIGGFGYLRWKQGGFDFLKPSRAVAPAQNAPDSGNPPPASIATPDAAAPNPAVPNPATPTAATPSSASPTPPNPGAPNSNSPAADAGAAGAGAAPAASGAASSGTEGTSPPTTPANSAPASGAPADNAGAPAKAQDSASPDQSTQSESEDADAGPSKPESAAQPDVTKPSAARTLRARKPTPVTPLDPAAEAQKYIYGQGVAQDCDRGLRLLKPAAAQANTKAMILLGSLYSSGTCTPRDLPTAYRWFALSLHKEPDNQRLQDDLQKLWSQMTQPERQLAIKLSQ
jgi:zinc-ribbon domain